MNAHMTFITMEDGCLYNIQRRKKRNFWNAAEIEVPLKKINNFGQQKQNWVIGVK